MQAFNLLVINITFCGKSFHCNLNTALYCSLWKLHNFCICLKRWDHSPSSVLIKLNGGCCEISILQKVYFVVCKQKSYSMKNSYIWFNLHFAFLLSETLRSWVPAGKERQCLQSKTTWWPADLSSISTSEHAQNHPVLFLWSQRGS